MTAKRWEIIDEEFISYTGGTAQLISNGECEIHLWERPKDAQLFCDKLNAINEENEQLRTALKELREIGDYQEGRIQELNEENTRLQERNNRQCRQLDNLYTLIEKQDWKTLKGLIQEFEESEERLRREWSDYE